MKNITVCKKVCKECGFTKDGTTDTLYHEALGMMKQGAIFPCHMELKKISGDESYGVEMMDEIKVCRGYVAFVAREFPMFGMVNPVWRNLLSEITEEELDNIRSMGELYDSHIALRNGWELGNNG